MSDYLQESLAGSRKTGCSFLPDNDASSPPPQGKMRKG
jgi:hypothetical protein